MARVQPILNIFESTDGFSVKADKNKAILVFVPATLYKITSDNNVGLSFATSFQKGDPDYKCLSLFGGYTNEQCVGSTLIESLGHLFGTKKPQHISSGTISTSMSVYINPCHHRECLTTFAAYKNVFKNKHPLWYAYIRRRGREVVEVPHICMFTVIIEDKHFTINPDKPNGIDIRVINNSPPWYLSMDHGDPYQVIYAEIKFLRQGYNEKAHKIGATSSMIAIGKRPTSVPVPTYVTKSLVFSGRISDTNISDSQSESVSESTSEDDIKPKNKRSKKQQKHPSKRTKKEKEAGNEPEVQPVLFMSSAFAPVSSDINAGPSTSQQDEVVITSVSDDSN